MIRLRFETFYGKIKLFKKWNEQVTECLPIECYGPDTVCDSVNPCIIWQEDASFKEQSSVRKTVALLYLWGFAV